MRRHHVFYIAILLCVVLAPRGTAADESGRIRRQLLNAGENYERGNYQDAWFGFWGLARQGDAVAQFNLAQLYRMGVGIPADLRIAHYWYAEAAAQGHAYAQYNLGMMYERGDGATLDIAEARAWYRRAAARNVPGASTALLRLDKPRVGPPLPAATPSNRTSASDGSSLVPR
jgi:TPR repeat protein